MMLHLPLFLLCLQASSSSAWTFHDDVERAGRSMVMFHTMELVDQLVQPLHAADQPPAASKYSLLTLGSQHPVTLAVVWHSASGRLWVDSNGDGRFSSEEKLELLAGTRSISVKLDLGNGPVQRTLLVKRRGTSLAYAVRGYQSGSVSLNGHAFQALLQDGNGDGCFDGVGQDRIWIDLNQDGQFDPLTEQFLLGKPIQHAGNLLLLRSNAAGTVVSAHLRPTETGTVRLKVGKLDPTQIAHLSARFVSDWGELIEITQANLAAQLPIGRYRLDQVTLTILDHDQRRWNFTFHSDRSFAVNVEKGMDRFIDLVPDLKVVIHAEKTAQPGD